MHIKVCGRDCGYAEGTQQERGSTMFSKIVVGTDGSEAAVRALKLACELAEKCDASLSIIHVPRPETVAFALGAVAGYHMVTTMPPDEEVEEAAQKVLELAGEAATVPVEQSEIRHGDPGDETVAFAKDIGADLIVTGRRALANLAGLVVGSTSQRITHIAPCAVLTVP